MRSAALGVALVVVGLVLTAAGLFGQLVLTEDEGHHDGRTPTFALDSAQGADELVVDAGSPNELVVAIERAGQPIQAFDDVHGAPLHVFAVRTDLTEYRHVDPALVDGAFESIPVAGGEYRVVVQAAPKGGPDLLELGADVSATADAMPSGQNITTTDVYEIPGGPTVERQGFDFVLSEPWQGEEYHGGPALLTLFRAGDGAFTHAHATVPSETRLRFNLDLPGPGDYLAALEFVHDGEVRTALFRFEI